MIETLVNLLCSKLGLTPQGIAQAYRALFAEIEALRAHRLKIDAEASALREGSRQAFATVMRKLDAIETQQTQLSDRVQSVFILLGGVPENLYSHNGEIRDER